MDIKELESDLIALGLGDNINQAKLLYLCFTKRFFMGNMKIGMLIEGRHSLMKEIVVVEVARLFPKTWGVDVIRDCVVMTERQADFSGYVAGTLSKHIPVYMPGLFIIALNNSEEARENIGRLRLKRRTLEGILYQKQLEIIRKKHEEFQSKLEKSIAISVPYAERIRFVKGTSIEEKERFINLIEAIACICQEKRPIRTEKELKYKEATIDDFHQAKEILSNIHILESEHSVSADALAFGDKLITRFKDKPFTRKDLSKLFTNEFKTIKPIEKRLKELIEAGYIEILKRGGDKNRFEYVLNECFLEGGAESLMKKRYSDITLS